MATAGLPGEHGALRRGHWSNWSHWSHWSHWSDFSFRLMVMLIDHDWPGIHCKMLHPSVSENQFNFGDEPCSHGHGAKHVAHPVPWYEVAQQSMNLAFGHSTCLKKETKRDQDIVTEARVAWHLCLKLLPGADLALQKSLRIVWLKVIDGWFFGWGDAAEKEAGTVRGNCGFMMFLGAPWATAILVCPTKRVYALKRVVFIGNHCADHSEITRK